MTRLPLIELSVVNSIIALTVRHLEGANYSFADGHVKWLKRDAIMNADATTVVNGSNYGFKFAVAS